METLVKLVAETMVIALVLVIVALFMGLPLMLLWDWLMPSLFGLREITFFEAVGLNILSGILFGRSSSSSSKS